MNSRARWIRHSISVLSYSYRITPYAHICARRERQCKDGRIQVKSIGSGSGSDLAKNFGPDPDPDPVLVKMSGRLASWADWLLAWCMLNFLRPFYQVFSLFHEQLKIIFFSEVFKAFSRWKMSKFRIRRPVGSTFLPDPDPDLKKKFGPDPDPPDPPILTI